MLEGARNLAVGRRYGVVSAVPGGRGGRLYLHLSTAIDEAVDRTRACGTAHPGWHVIRTERGRLPEVVWPTAPGDDGDGEESLIPRRPRRPAGSGAIALPFP